MMFPRLLLCCVFIAASAATLLTFRHARLQTLHDMGRLHASMNTTRTATWDLQVRIAEATHPHALRAAIVRARLHLEPVPTTPTPTAPGVSALADLSAPP